jgi:hypothetical protein
MSNEYKSPEPPDYRSSRRLSKTEKVMETKEYKRERLQALTGIEDEQQLHNFYFDLKEIFFRVGLDNVKYRKNSVDSRYQTETELAFLHLNEEELAEVENVLRPLRIFGFPESEVDTNFTSLIVENKRDLEVLRLLSVFKDLDHAVETKKRVELLQVEMATQEERRQHEEKKRELERQYEKERREYTERMAADKAAWSKRVDALLEAITPQTFDMATALADIEELPVDPYVDTTKYRGYQPILPKVRKREQSPDTKAQELREFFDEVDPIELDEKVEQFTKEWQNGSIIDLNEEPLALPDHRSRTHHRTGDCGNCQSG